MKHKEHSIKNNDDNDNSMSSRHLKSNETIFDELGIQIKPP